MENSEEEKDIGVVVGSKLKFGKHCREATLVYRHEGDMMETYTILNDIYDPGILPYVEPRGYSRS